MKTKIFFKMPQIAKKRIGVLLVCLMGFFICLNSCSKPNENGRSDTTQSTESTKATSSSESTEQDVDASTTDVDASTTINSQKPDNSTTHKAATTTIKKTTTTRGSTTITKHTADKIELKIVNYFPELPGYSTEYEIGMICDGNQRQKGEYTLKVTPKDLVVRDNVVIATDQQKKTHSKFVVEAVDKFTGKKAQLTITPKKWEVNFEDNFNGNSMNNDIWSLFEYEHTNVSVKNGALTLLAERLIINGQVKYTSSGIRTLSKHSLKGGCFMARMKSPDKGGCNSAFWLMPEGRYTKDFFFMDTELDSMGCSEIDIVEYSPFYKKQFPITQHFWNRSSGAHKAKSYWVDCATNIYEDYHEYACIWEPDGIYYYFDGKPAVANRDIDTHSSAVEAYIVLSTNSAKIHDDLEWLGPCTDDMFPFATSFDWVKTYY